MKRKFLGRVSAVAMASAMMVSMFGMSVSAEEGAAPKNVDITKEITKQSNVFAPNTTFEFTVAPATGADLNSDENVITSGPVGGVTFTDNKIVSKPAITDINKSSITLTDKATLKVDEEKFSTPGIYRYVVKETEGNYDGITYSTEKKYFDVYVNADGEVYAYFFANEDAEKGKNDGKFVNDYDKDGTLLHDLKITKEVTGNQGDKNKDFSFDVTISGEAGEQYYMTFSDNGTPVTLTSDTKYTFKLKDDVTATITGLDSDDTYTINETDYSSEKYETTITGADKVNGTTVNGAATKGTKAEGVADGKDEAVKYTNDKTVSTPTGIIMNIAPYIILVAAAGLAALFFLRRRSRREF